MYHKNDLLYDQNINTNDGRDGQHLRQQSSTGTSELEISISARNLLNRDLVSKSDPQCIVYQFNGSQYIEICKTEVIRDNLNPDWVKKVVIPYHFNVKQQLRFEIFDYDDYTNNEFLGRADLTLAQIVSANNSIYKQSLKTGLTNFNRVGGQIWLQSEEISANKQIARIMFSANNLDKKDFFGKSDPYLVISRHNPDDSYSAVHRTEVVKKSLNPIWRPFDIRVQTLCNGSYDRKLKIDCYDWDDGTNHQLIGSFITTLKQLTQNQTIYQCINDKKKRKKKGYTNSGTIKVNSIEITTEITFLDYIKSGTQMHFVVSVDFTASNGPPNDFRSLHRLDPTGETPNSYEIALKAIGEILEPYDTLGLTAAFGFGAKIGPNYQLSHHFPLNANPSYPYCKGIDEVLSCYRRTLESVTLHGPTNFAPTINFAANIAKGLQDGKHYFVLLIITDGVITDMNETLEAIVNASALPLSIIIVGVGGADFTSMEFLDGDGRTLMSKGRPSQRDIVQFVPMRNYMKGNWVQHSYELSRDVLAEIPTQFIQFMKSRGFKPQTSDLNRSAFPEPSYEPSEHNTNEAVPHSSHSYAHSNPFPPQISIPSINTSQPAFGQTFGPNSSLSSSNGQTSNALYNPYVNPAQPANYGFNCAQNYNSGYAVNQTQDSSPAPSAPQF